MANVRVNGSEEVHKGMVTHDDGESVDIDVIVNFNPTANIVSTNTLKGGNAESESEVGDVESESESEANSKSKSKSTSDEGDFSPGPNGPPGQGTAKSESVIDKAKKLLPGNKKNKKKDSDKD